MSDYVRTPESTCMNCGAKLNALGASDGSEATPEPGDAVVCIKCGAVMKVAANLTPRGMTEAEMKELLADKEWMDEVARLVHRVYFVRHMQSWNAQI